MTKTPGKIAVGDSGASNIHDSYELLPEYATAAALGYAPDELYPAVAAHLDGCPACQADLAELLELIIPAYNDEIAVVARYPPPNLSFLNQPAPASSAQPNPWRIDDAGRLVIEFTEALINTLRGPSLAGVARGQLMFQYVQEPGSVDDLEVTIEAFVEDQASGIGRVHVAVEVPSRGPFAQAGSRIELCAGDQTWRDETDDTGGVDFTPIPLAALPRLHAKISAPK